MESYFVQTNKMPPRALEERVYSLAGVPQNFTSQCRGEYFDIGCDEHHEIVSSFYYNVGKIYLVEMF